MMSGGLLLSLSVLIFISILVTKVGARFGMPSLLLFLLLGMLLGLIPNLLTIVFTERIYALLFALVPIAAIFGYKLLGGRMDRASIVVVILVSLLGVPVMIYFELVIYIVQEYGASLKEALSAALEVVKEVAFWREESGELLQLLLFMGLALDHGLIAVKFGVFEELEDHVGPGV